MIRFFDSKQTWQLWAVVGDPKAARQLADDQTVVLCYDNISASGGNLIVPKDTSGEFIWSLLEDCDFVIRRSSFGEQGVMKIP